MMVNLMIYKKYSEGFKRKESEGSECNLRNLQQKKQKTTVSIQRNIMVIKRKRSLCRIATKNRGKDNMERERTAILNIKRQSCVK